MLENLLELPVDMVNMLVSEYVTLVLLVKFKMMIHTIFQDVSIVAPVNIKIKMDNVFVKFVPPVNIKIKIPKADVNNVQMVNTTIKTNKVAANPVEKDYTLHPTVQQVAVHAQLESTNQKLQQPNTHVHFVYKVSPSWINKMNVNHAKVDGIKPKTMLLLLSANNALLANNITTATLLALLVKVANTNRPI